MKLFLFLKEMKKYLSISDQYQDAHAMPYPLLVIRSAIHIMKKVPDVRVRDKIRRNSTRVFTICIWENPSNPLAIA